MPRAIAPWTNLSERTEVEPRSGGGTTYGRSADERGLAKDWDRIEGNWKQFAGKVKEKCGDLTDDDIAKINGKREQLEGVLIASGFFWPLLKTVNLVGALCLLTNRAPAFGFALIVPVITVIVLFHLFLNPQGLPMAASLVVCSLLLIRAYWP